MKHEITNIKCCKCDAILKNIILPDEFESLKPIGWLKFGENYFCVKHNPYYAEVGLTGVNKEKT